MGGVPIASPPKPEVVNEECHESANSYHNISFVQPSHPQAHVQRQYEYERCSRVGREGPEAGLAARRGGRGRSGGLRDGEDDGAPAGSVGASWGASREMESRKDFWRRHEDPERRQRRLEYDQSGGYHEDRPAEDCYHDGEEYQHPYVKSESRDPFADASFGRAVLHGAYDAVYPQLQGWDWCLPSATPAYQGWPISKQGHDYYRWDRNQQWVYPQVLRGDAHVQPPLTLQGLLGSSSGPALSIPNAGSKQRKTATSLTYTTVDPSVHSHQPKTNQVYDTWRQIGSPITDTTRKQPQQAPFNLPIRPQLRDRNNPRLNLIQRPKPTPLYLARSNKPSKILSTPQRLLVILDLNGTLLHRSHRGASFKPRPKVNDFLRYLLHHHKIVVWSSAKPVNVTPMCSQLFTPAELEGPDGVVAVWARDKLHLPSHAYNQKTQVYKQLSWLWQDAAIQAAHPDVAVVPKGRWDQGNTVLVDDSFEKAASEPHNLVKITEFEGKHAEMGQDVLGQVVRYLEAAKWRSDVSAYIKEKPFEWAEDGVFDWETVRSEKGKEPTDDGDGPQEAGAALKEEANDNE